MNEHFTDPGCRVAFEIEKFPTGKRVCDGYFDYTLVTLATGRSTPLPDDVRANYSLLTPQFRALREFPCLEGAPLQPLPTSLVKTLGDSFW